MRNNEGISRRMRHLAIALAAMVTLGVLLLVLQQRPSPHIPEAPVADLLVTPNPVDPADPMPVAPLPTTLPSPTPSSGAEKGISQVAANGTTPVPTTLYDLYGATSEEDEAWLQNAGFPDLATMDILERSSDTDLEQLARGGDLVAANILAWRKAKQGGAGMAPIDALFEAVVDGSVHALKVMADIHTFLPEYRNPILASAYNQVAAMRGYYNALTGNLLLDAGMSAEDRYAANLYALIPYENLQRAHSQRYGTPFAPDPRPGLFDLWAEIDAYYSRARSDDP